MNFVSPLVEYVQNRKILILTEGERYVVADRSTCIKSCFYLTQARNFGVVDCICRWGEAFAGRGKPLRRQLGNLTKELAG